jgi:hypothetical protein
MLRKVRVRVVECRMCSGFFFFVFGRVEYVKAGYVVCCHKHRLGSMSEMCGLRKTMVLHVCARRLSVTKEL